MPHLSIVIPVYKGAATIGKVVDDCFAALSHLDFEIILVDDGSGDTTEDTIFTLAKKHPHVKAIALAKNVGEFNAVLCGLTFATGAYTTIIDDDGQNSPAEILKLLAKAEQGFDVVYAKYPKKMHSWWRNAGSWLNNFFACAFIGKPFGLYLSSFKVMKRSLVEKVVSYTKPNVYPDVLILKYAQQIGVAEAVHNVAEMPSRYSVGKLFRVFSSMLLTRFGVLGYIFYYLLITVALLGLLVVFSPLLTGIGKHIRVSPWVYVGIALPILMILPNTGKASRYQIKRTSF